MTADADIGALHTRRILRGWKEIAAYLEVSPLRAQERAKRFRDPLPVMHDHRGPFAYVDALRDWVDRSRLAYQAHLQSRGSGHGVARSREATPTTEKRRPMRDAT